MAMRDETEDGTGFYGLVYSSETNDYADAKVAEGERLAQEADALQTNAYAEGRKDEREVIEQELIPIISGPYYMDPPDGGDVPLMEQLRRMAQDAAKWREQAARTARAIACELACEGGGFDPWAADRDAQMNPATDGDPGMF